MSKNIRNIEERDDLEYLRQKYKEQQIQSIWYDKDEINGWLKSVSSKGEFPDIDYKDFSVESYSLYKHLYYVNEMARAYTNHYDDFYLKDDLKKLIDLCIKNWTDNHYKSADWWYNQIAIPQYMTKLLYIMDEHLTKEQINAMLTISADASYDGSGARPSGDRVIIAEINFQNACFKRNTKDAEYALEVIQGEIHFVGEGNVEQKEEYFDAAPMLEKDYSFHHRTDGVNNTIDYGPGWIIHFMDVATTIYDTKYRFKDGPTKILIDYFLEGLCKQMVYSAYYPEGLLNRDIGRVKSEEREDTKLVSQLLQIGNGYRKDELENVIALRNGDYIEHPEIIPSFAKYFFSAELFTYQRPGLYSVVRMYSKRMNNMDYQPSDGVINHFRGDGTNYIQITGKEYTNITPVFDFRRVPGATILQVKEFPGKVNLRGINDFTGGVSDGLYGAAAFDFISPHYDLKAKKSWFYFDKEYVCLGTKINSKEDLEIFTTLEQNFHQGGASVAYEDNNKDKEEIINLGGKKNFTKAEWVHHGNVGYYFLDKANIGITNIQTTGKWTKMNQRSDACQDTVTKNVFTLWINHGKKIDNGTYAYAILPNVTVAETKNYENHIEVLANNEKLQAVRHKDLKIAYGILYEKGKFELPSGIEINTNASCIIMVKEEKGQIKELTLSDPNKREFGIHLGIKGKFESKEGIVIYEYDKEKDLTNAVVSLPQGHYIGQPLTIKNVYQATKENEGKEGDKRDAKNSKVLFDNWWIIIAVAGALILVLSMVFICRRRKKKNSINDKNIENILEKEGLYDQK